MTIRFAWLAGLLAGCTLFESGGGPGDDVPPPPGGGPVGRSFLIERAQTAPSQCDRYGQENDSHSIDVEQTMILVDGLVAAGPVVRPQAAIEDNGDSPNVAFRVFENWSSVEFSASPSIQYEIWVSGNLITGRANTSFPNPGVGPTVCFYQWNLSSF